jgi:hypothetical protein
MTNNPALIKWLKGEIEYRDGGDIVIVDSTVQNYRLLVRECCDANLLEISEIDRRLNIHYRLTSSGKRELRVAITANEADIPATEKHHYRAIEHHIVDDLGNRLGKDGRNWFVYDCADRCAEILNAETALLREQLEQQKRDCLTIVENLRETVKEAESEIAMHETLVPKSTSDAQERETVLRRELNATLRVIREAHARLNDSRIKDYDKVALAAEILEPYTEPKEQQS